MLSNLITIILIIMIYAYKHSVINFQLKNKYYNDIPKHKEYCAKMTKFIEETDEYSLWINKIGHTNRKIISNNIQIYDSQSSRKIKEEKKLFNKHKYIIITLSIKEKNSIIEDKSTRVIEENYNQIIVDAIKKIKVSF